ncbi:MAG: competence/damage-inducible protein A [bacterium]|jgi:nicotinamide-nucleotide amidase
MNAIILSIGDELVLGQTLDSNSAWLSARLADRGIIPLYHKTIADDLEATVRALRLAVDETDLVVVTGGLGPTQDDLTRQALAAFMNKPLDLHPPSLERMKAFFKLLGREMPLSNRIQAHFPRGAEVLDNDWGTAPGIKLKAGKTLIFALPGVPYEMEKMSERYIFPLFEKNSGMVVAVESLATFGAGESTVAEKLGELMRRDRNPLVGTTVSGGIVTVRFRSEAPTVELAQKQLVRIVALVRERLGVLVFAEGKQSLPEALGQLAKAKSKRLVTAESCTGGLVAKMLTDVPGSSAWFDGGWVTYSNAMKSDELTVSSTLVEQEGAVSEAVACAMAAGALKHSTADYSIALTGIAGPDGGSDEKPVGLVWIAIGGRDGTQVTTHAECFRFPGNRDMIRDRAAKTALNLLRLELLKAIGCQL